MNLEVIVAIGFGYMVFGAGVAAIIKALYDIQRTLAKLPAHLNERREIVLPPREEARQGDVVFHIPSSLYGDRS